MLVTYWILLHLSGLIARSYEGQTGRDLDLALQEHQTAEDYWKWKKSGFYIHDLFENVIALGKKTEFCENLVRLPDEKIILFEDELENPNAGGQLPCQSELIVKIEAFHKQREQILLSQKHFSRKLASKKESDRRLSDGVERIQPSLNLGPKEIALVFYGYGSQAEQLLQFLNLEKISVYFFPNEDMRTLFPAFLRKAYLKKHITGITPRWDKNFKSLPIGEAERQIAGLMSEVQMASGEKPRFILESGDTLQPMLLNHIRERGLISVEPNIDSLDWKGLPPQAALSAINAKLIEHNRGIILFHSLGRHSFLLLKYLVQALKQQDYSIIALGAPKMRPADEPTLKAFSQQSAQKR